MFEKATRLKLRFKLHNGMVSTEDLWDLSLERLDTLAKTLNKEVETSKETSYIKTVSRASTVAKLKFDVVIAVINHKLAAAEAKTSRKLRAQKRAQLQELIDKKVVSVQESKSIQELEKELAELED